MIVRNEAHIIHEALDSVAPYISSWVIVDTGSDDGTQDLIRNHMARLGIPGELHERPWRNFGHNRTEALTLAQGHGDYIWVMDADDIVVGTPDFTRLSADIYLHALISDRRRHVYWRPQLFRDGLRVRYVGVIHETPRGTTPTSRCASRASTTSKSRRLGARNLDPQKYARDRDLLLAEVERNPEDARSVFYLAQSYFGLGDFVNARKWYARRVEMGGWDEEVYCRDVPGRGVDGATRCAVARRSGRLPAGLGVSTDPRRAAVCHRLSLPRRSALPSSATSSPSAPPKSRFPNRTYCLSAQTSTPGAQPTSRRCAHPGSASMPRRSRCGGACWPDPTSPTRIGKGSRATATFVCRR